MAGDILPDQTVQQLKTEFSMTIANGQAQYQREAPRPCIIAVSRAE
jgi:hypothetical protein